MSQMRRVIQQRNNLSNSDTETIENVLRAYSERRIDDQQAAQQLRPYVPNQAGLDLNDLLPILLALLSGRQGQGGISDLIGNFLGGQQNQSYPNQGSGGLGDLVGTLLGGGQQNTQYPNQPTSRDIDLPGLIGTFLSHDQPAPQQRPPQHQGGGLFDLVNSLLGSDPAETPYRASTNQPPPADHNLRKRQ